MRQGANVAEQSRNAEDLYELRLMSLLQDLVKEKGRRGTARVLGVDHRTLATSMEEGRLSKRVRGALEFALLTGADPEAARQREWLASLETRVGELEKWARAGQAELRSLLETEIAALREDYAQAMRLVEKRLTALESDPGHRDEERPRVKPVQRQYPELVTPEPEAGEEQVYGDAMTLVAEWRKVRAECEAAKTKLSQATALERKLELEIELIDKHRLTFPPSTYPWDLSRRRNEVRIKQQVLREVGVERALAQLRRWIRRVFTLGLWRN